MKIKFHRENNEFLIKSEYKERNAVKSLGLDLKWNKNSKIWIAKATLDNIEKIKQLNIPIENYSIFIEFENEMQRIDKLAHRIKTNKIKIKKELIPGLKKTLFAHQETSFAFGLTRGSFADFSEVGTGKTAVQIALIKYRFEKNLIDRVLIVCPKSIMYKAWVDDIKKFTTGISWCVLDYGSKKNKYILKYTNYKVYIINYASAWRVIDEIREKKFDMCILDESTKIKNIQAKVTKNILKNNNFKYRSIMSGLPTPNSLLEIFPQMRFMNELIFGDNFYRFKDKYFYPSGYGGYEWKVKSKKAMNEIKNKIDAYSISFKKDDCFDLPDKIFVERDVELSIEESNAYKQAKEEALIILENEIIPLNTILNELNKLNQITNGFVYSGDKSYRLDNPSKIQELETLLEEIISNKNKVIIWATYAESIQMIFEKFSKKYSAVTMYGKTPQKVRESNIDRFQNDNNCKLMIAHPGTAGHGLTLTSANYCIWYSQTYSYESYVQANGRIDRHGQKKKMTYINLLSKNMNKNTINHVIMSALKRKSKLNDFILENKKRIINEI